MTHALRFTLPIVLAAFGLLSFVSIAQAGTVGISPGSIVTVVEKGDIIEDKYTLSTTPEEAINIKVTPGEDNQIPVDFEDTYRIGAGETHVELPFTIDTSNLDVGVYENTFSITEGEPDVIPEGYVHIALGVTAQMRIEVVDRLSDREVSKLVTIDNLYVEEPEFASHPYKARFEIKNSGQFHEGDMMYIVEVFDRSGNSVFVKESDPFALSAEHTSPIKVSLDNLEEGTYDVKAKVKFRGDYETDTLKEKFTIDGTSATQKTNSWPLLIVGIMALVGGLVVILRQKNRPRGRK